MSSARERLMRTVACPTCSASVGHPCRAEGKPFYAPHAGHYARRSRALAEAWGERRTSPVARPPATRWGALDGAS